MSEREKIADIIMKRAYHGVTGINQAIDIANEILQDISIETLRDKFAMRAMTIGIAQSRPLDQAVEIYYKVADAMLAERAK